MEKIKLHLGCGDKKIKGWVNIGNIRWVKKTGRGQSSPLPWLTIFFDYKPPTATSTRRFWARPSSVSLFAIGLASP